MSWGANIGRHTETLPDSDWMADAACRDLDTALFFLDEDGPDTPAARGYYLRGRAVCRRCPVRFECLDYAVRAGIHHGLWGGLSPSERSRIRRGTP